MCDLITDLRMMDDEQIVVLVWSENDGTRTVKDEVRKVSSR